MPSPRIAAPMDMMDHGALEEGITQFQELEEECLGPDEEIQQGDLRLQALMNERVWLRKKSAMAEEEVKKLEEGIKKDFLDKKTVVIKQDVHDYVHRLGDYHRELINSMLWIGPYVTKGIANGGAM